MKVCAWCIFVCVCEVLTCMLAHAHQTGPWHATWDGSQKVRSLMSLYVVVIVPVVLSKLLDPPRQFSIDYFFH